MIPIKEAITIFEQHKIDQIRNSDLIKFSSELYTSGFSAPEYIIGKIKEWVDYEDGYGTFKPKNNLLSYLKKIYHREGKEPHIDEGLSLYGKKVTCISRVDSKYEEIYIWNYFPTGEYWEIECDFSIEAYKVKRFTDLNEKVKSVKEAIFTDLFENYNYEEIYNPSTNYTVMGDKVTNTITYMDICVDNTEFKTFLESEFNNDKSSKYGELINKTLEKYVNKVDEVFRITIEKKKLLDPAYIPRDFPGIDKNEVKTLDEFIDKHIKRQIKYNKTL